MMVRQSPRMLPGPPRATAPSLVPLLVLLASPARADVSECGWAAAVEGTSVRLKMGTTLSPSGHYGGCPAATIVRRTDESGHVEEFSAEWSGDCTLPPLECCGSFLDRCTPPGRLQYDTADSCAPFSRWVNPHLQVERGTELCPEPEAGCGCSTTGEGRRAVALAVLCAMLLVGLAAWRRARPTGARRC